MAWLAIWNMKKGITTKINAHDITWRTVLEACEHFLFQLLRQGHDIQLLDLQARGDDSPVVKNHWADWWVEACTVGPFQVFQSFSLFSRSFTQISQFAIVPHSLYPQGDKPRVFWAFFFSKLSCYPWKDHPLSTNNKNPWKFVLTQVLLGGMHNHGRM